MYKISEEAPDHVRSELAKLIENPDKYRKMYPVAYKALIKYLVKEEKHGKDQKRPSK